MEETGPIIAGVLIAVAASYVPERHRLAVTAVLCVVAGVGWAALVGELTHSWAYAGLDVAQVAVACAVTGWLWRRYRGASAPEADVADPTKRR